MLSVRVALTIIAVALVVIAVLLAIPIIGAIFASGVGLLLLILATIWAMGVGLSGKADDSSEPSAGA